MKNYTVSIYVSETQTDTFTIKAEDQVTAQGIAMTEAHQRGYDIDDVIDVVQEREDIDKAIQEIREKKLRICLQQIPGNNSPANLTLKDIRKNTFSWEKLFSTLCIEKKTIHMKFNNCDCCYVSLKPTICFSSRYPGVANISPEELIKKIRGEK